MKRFAAVCALAACATLASAQGAGQRALTPKPAPDPATADCERLWQAYFRSQACYERYRNVGGSVKPDALARCGEPLPDPSAQCGPRRAQR